MPQTIAASQFTIAMDVLGETYTYTLPDELILAKNTRYSLVIKVTSDKMVIANIETTPWNATDDEIFAPDWIQKILINTQTTTIPNNSVLDVNNNSLKISHRGGVATIDFQGQYDKILTISNPNPRLTIVGSLQTKYKDPAVDHHRHTTMGGRRIFGAISSGTCAVSGHSIYGFRG